ncbi:MAG: hypothetical protein HQL17_00320 [Candidatus Omnitrophica bacterium]|nr:hypothetical protein [Candidatus Omnitrophota bacterium]
MVQVKRIDVWSLSRLLGVVQGAFGFVTGVFFTLTYLIDPEFLQSSVGGIGSFFGVWSFIVLPVINAALGLLTGAMLAWVYNAYVRFLGAGIQVDVDVEQALKLNGGL